MLTDWIKSFSMMISFDDPEERDADDPGVEEAAADDGETPQAVAVREAIATARGNFLIINSI